MTGLEFAHTLEISIDGERVFTAEVGGEKDNLASDTNMSEAANAIDERLKTRVAVKAGPHDVGVTFVRRNRAESDEPLQQHERNHDLQDMNGLPLIDYVSLTGPFDATGPGDDAEPRAHLHLHARPKRGRQKRPARGRILAAWRAAPIAGRSTADDLAPILEQYTAGRDEGHLRAAASSTACA